MKLVNQEDCLLLIIDIQEKLLNAVFNKTEVEKSSEILAKTANLMNLPVIVTEQYPKGLGDTVPSIRLNLPETSNYFEKISFSALDEEKIINTIKKYNKKQIIILGIETHICVHQTVSALLDEGFQVIVVKDACGSRSNSEYLSAMDIMKDNGAKIKTAEMVIFELLKTAKHPNFKEIQLLIK